MNTNWHAKICKSGSRKLNKIIRKTKNKDTIIKHNPCKKIPNQTGCPEINIYIFLFIKYKQKNWFLLFFLRKYIKQPCNKLPH